MGVSSLFGMFGKNVKVQITHAHFLRMGVQFFLRACSFLFASAVFFLPGVVVTWPGVQAFMVTYDSSF